MRSLDFSAGLLVFALSCLSLAPLHAQTNTQVSSCSAISLGPLGALNGFVPSSADAWHRDVSGAPVDPNSDKIINTSGDLANRHLHPDFSSVAGGAYGIPYTVVDSSQIGFTPFVNINYADESDIANYPIPADLPIEGTPGDCPTDYNDRHAIILDRNSCVIYEFFQAASCKSATPAWSASNGAMWDMLSSEKRPYGFTSVDAAGLSVFEGLIRYDEIVAGQINHAIRFTANHTKNNANNGFFVAPATHAAGSLWGTDNIMGMRIRLRADYDISGFSPTNQIILKAMKQYGMILADNGSDMFFQGTPDARWNDDDLNSLKTVPSSAFEVVKMDTVYDSESAPKGAAPVISSFTPSSAVISKGQSVTLTSVSDGSYSYIDQVGFTRGIVSVSPAQTTTYTLTSRNAYGTSTASTTVTVQATASANLNFAPVPDKTIGDPSFLVSASSNSTGAITYSVVSGPATISGSSVTLTGIGTVTIQASQAAAGNYGATTARISFNTNGLKPNLVFVAIPDQSSNAAPFQISASSDSQGAITYGVVSGPATLSGDTITITGAGRITLQASQAAAGNYAAATVVISFNATNTTSTLQFAPIPDQTFGAAPFAVSASSQSNGAVTYSVLSGPATVSGNVVSVNGVGVVTIQAAQASSGSFAATSATASFQVTRAAAVLKFAAIADQTYGAAPFAVTASSASDGAVAYAVMSGPATVAANVVTLTGTGTVSLQATQTATANYTAATAAASFSVKSVPATLQFSPIADRTYGAPSFPVTASSLSSGAITYSVLSGPATLSANVLTITGVGVVTVQADQPAAGNYAAASATATFQVLAAVPALAVNSIATRAAGASSFAPSATSLSQGAMTWTVTGPASLSNNLITVQGAGLVTVSVSQAAAGNYAAATASTTFVVQDFQLSLPQMITVSGGSSSSTTLAVLGQEGFTGTVNMSCALPATMIKTTCSATNVQLSPTTSQAAATVTITTVKAFQASNEGAPGPNSRALFLAMLAPLAFFYRRRRFMHVAIAILGLAVIGITGCGTGIAPGTAAGTYNVTVTAVSGSTTHAATIPVVVQ